MAPVDARARLEQIRRNKKQQTGKQGSSSNRFSNNGTVKDLRQIIVKKSKRKNDRSPNQTIQGRIGKNKTRSSSASGHQDLRDSNRKLASRRNLSQSRDKTNVPSRGVVVSDRRPPPAETRPNPRVASRAVPAVMTKREVPNATRPVKIGKKIVQQLQYYVPPHMQREQVGYAVAGPAVTERKNDTPQHHDPPSTTSVGGASILISNLSPEATQSDIIEIFGNVGVMTAVNIINQTTALVTYQTSSDAVRAVKFYNNRLLDGKPMLVNMMPNNI